MRSDVSIITDTCTVAPAGRTHGACASRSPRLRIAAVVAVLAVSARSATPDEGPSAAVRAALEKASTVASPNAPHEQQLDTLRIVARELVDTQEMGRRALGSVFATLTRAQQQEFLRLFDELFVRAYMQKLLLFRSPTFRVHEEQPRGDAIVIPTETVLGKDSYAVDYEMHRVDGQWRAADVIVEGVSMTSNYSAQFAGLLKSRSIDELLEFMRRKVEHFTESP